MWRLHLPSLLPTMYDNIRQKSQLQDASSLQLLVVPSYATTLCQISVRAHETTDCVLTFDIANFQWQLRKLTRLSALLRKTHAAEYQSGSAVFVAKIKKLETMYKSIRRARGDGNCFFRSFIFAYMESLVHTADLTERNRCVECSALRHSVRRHDLSGIHGFLPVAHVSVQNTIVQQTCSTPAFGRAAADGHLAYSYCKSRQHQQTWHYILHMQADSTMLLSN